MKSLFTIAVILFSIGFAEAQSSYTYWVVETNVHEKNFTILRIYDSQNALLHEETLKGKALNVQLRKDRKRIDRKVKEVLKHQALALNKK